MLEKFSIQSLAKQPFTLSSSLTERVTAGHFCPHLQSALISPIQNQISAAQSKGKEEIQLYFIPLQSSHCASPDITAQLLVA